MARDILGEFGPDRTTGPASLPGGVTEAKSLDYKPPKGPSNINDPKSPGIHGTNHGHQGTQGRH